MRGAGPRHHGGRPPRPRPGGRGARGAAPVHAPQVGSKILRTRYHKHGNPLENATENPLDNSSEDPPESDNLRPAAGSSTSVSRKDFRPAFAVRKGNGCAVQILKMQEDLGLYAHAREKRYLAMFVSSDDSLLQLCFQGWLLQSRTQRAKRLPGAERIGFKPDPGKAVWIQRSE